MMSDSVCQDKVCSQLTANLSQHEINYTPSRWSKRYEDEELLAYFFDFAGRTTAKVRKSVKCDLNVPYGNTERTKYDVYGTDLPKNAPVFIFIHGGYWQEFSKELTGFTVPAFVENGVKVVSVGYDLCPNVRLGEIVSEIKAAVEQILETAADSGSRRVWISGHSAGAHLAASLLHDKSWQDRMTQRGYFRLLKGFLLIGGVYNLRPLLTTSFNAALKLTDEEIKAYSFSRLDTEQDQSVQGLRVVVTVGECDSPVFVNESREYAQKLITFVDNVEYILLRENCDHFDIAEKLVGKDYLLTKLVLKDMFAE